MPELPEVETIARGLAAHVLGEKVREVRTWHPRSTRRQSGGAETFMQLLSASRFTQVRRRGKFMWFELDRPGASEDLALVIHLGMSGQIYVSNAGEEDARLGRRPHEHVRLLLEGGSVVSFVDQRTFGHLQVVPTIADPWGGPIPIPRSLTHIAPDPLEEAFTPEAVAARWRASQAPIKAGLLNQGLVSGIGNIYADESLHRCGVHGARRGRNLRVWECLSLLETAQKVMRKAISEGGTSFDALYVDVSGEPGYFAHSLVAYGRGGEPCLGCGQQLQTTVVAGRSHVFCPVCQPRSKPRPVGHCPSLPALG
ncbi:MAG: bifunctional DNA-formamidopyrimidine glycosylase/DNA-(apurinic or apyrimidinic site) lyase [Actinomycetaceae bacterium]|nr:bifunctional DNA-formamidopyrimidine glycosylase/DNA-(apurinic or apyrimidinic site) lyase [Actinomycetaceae bacterium]